ncbi:MAG: AAA domain-containing protein [Clostridia bacterium]|nr:AAA domain-containing protein [Clostridia bacterium]
MCKNGFELVCLENEISYVKFSNADKTLLEYWKDCANETNDFTIKNLLNDQYEKIKFFNEDSVLYSYVNQITEKHELENEIICPFNFNKTQIDAIRNCLTNQISIINGPPGTGKTNTILNIISNLIIRGKSVAVVSATNSAISNIEQKLDKKNYKSIYASLGNEENKAKFFNKNKIDEKFLSTDNNKLNKQLLNKLSILFNLDNDRSIKAELLNCLRLEKEYYEKFSNCNTNTEESKNFRFKSAESLIKYVTRYQHDTQNKKFTFFLWLKLIFKYGFKKSLLVVKDRDKLITSLEYKYYILKINEIHQEIKNIQSTLDQEDLFNLLNKYKEISTNIFNQYINENLFKNNNNFTQSTYKKNFGNFIKRFPIITTTALSFISSIDANSLIDYVIIDEASQLTITSAIPMLNKCKNAIIVGDEKQLKPIDQFYTICNHNNAYDCNKNSLLTSFQELFRSNIRELLEHYRCAPAIIGFCNLKYYNNKLIPHKCEEPNAKPLILISVSKGNHMRKIWNGEKNGRYNQRELDVIDEILVSKELICHDETKIGVVTPYRLQTNKFQTSHPQIECNTIHKFQGGEKDIIIFSPVLDNRATKNDLEFVDNPNMINVTVSRAARQLVVIVNRDLFDKKGKEIHDLVNYISYKSMDNSILESKTISVFDYLYKAKENERKLFLANCSSKSNYYSERLLKKLLDNLINENSKYQQLVIQEQVKLRDFIIDKRMMTEEEKIYVNNNCSIDLLVKDKISNDIIVAIEVDGVIYHENNVDQLYKDNLKNKIFKKYDISLLRLPTNGSNEKQKIMNIFNTYLEKFKI